MAGRIHPSALLPPAATARILTTTDLRAIGHTTATIRNAVETGALIRIRRGHYLRGGTHPTVVTAAALGGRVDCVSLLALLGVFVLVKTHLHIHIPVGASRLPPRGRRVVGHWRPCHDDRRDTLADVVEALTQSVQCQPARSAVATLDSALHLRLIDEDMLTWIFRALPQRYQSLRPLVDGRAESGTETLVRLMLRAIGVRFDLQVVIDGVGRVDFLVDGWLIVECDSRAHHSEWADVVRDRRRDAAAATLGYTTVRLLAEDVFAAPDATADVLRGVLASPQLRPRSSRRSR